jgi:hypothetical protein
MPLTPPQPYPVIKLTDSGPRPAGKWALENNFIAIHDADNTAHRFLNALVCFEHEDAKSYISKNFVRDFDLNKLSAFFHGADMYKKLLCVEFTPAPRNCATNSILVMGKGGSSIIHLRMIHEPDSVSNWKIYSIDRE